MTSQQLKSRLAQAVAIFEDLEYFLQDPQDGWKADDLKNRVADFMDLHRQEQREGGVA